MRNPRGRKKQTWHRSWKTGWHVLRRTDLALLQLTLAFSGRALNITCRYLSPAAAAATSSCRRWRPWRAAGGRRRARTSAKISPIADGKTNEGRPAEAKFQPFSHAAAFGHILALLSLKLFSNTNTVSSAGVKFEL